MAWNAGIFLWQRRAIRDAIERYTGLVTMIGAVAGSDSGLTAAYDRLKPISIDHAVMEGAASDRRVVMASMAVGWSDLGSWTQLLAALGGTGVGRVVSPNEAVRADEADLIVERVGGRLAVSEGPRDILAANPVGAARGRRGEPRTGRCARGPGGRMGGTPVTEDGAEVPDRLRHRRLARAHCRGLHVRERPALRGRRRSLRRRARGAGQGRRPRL